jgi:SAM-dependent methyltransferase
MAQATTVAERRWADQLAGWAIPPGVLAAAPEPPLWFDPAVFARAAEDAMERRTPSQRAALAALPGRGSVLDVGCGAGAAGLPLAARAGWLVGVDESADMLAAFAERADELGVAHREVAGRWPDVAASVPPADVVLCHHVFYNVADLRPFALDLTDHARRRVVVELTERHPLAWMAPLWRALHGLDRPDGPTADDAVTVLRGLSLVVAAQRWSKPLHWPEADPTELVAFVRRRLCLPASRDADITAALDHHPPPATRAVVTLWWDGTAPV